MNIINEKENEKGNEKNENNLNSTKQWVYDFFSIFIPILSIYGVMFGLIFCV